MSTKLIVFFTLFIGAVPALRGQEPFDGHKWQAPYFLDTPQNWGIERFLIPIQFAPSITYKGVEDIRFAPGWAKKESEEYWAYTFLWFLDGNIAMDAKTIEKNLSAYYTGLLRANLDSATIAASKIGITKASARLITAEKNAQHSFEASVNTWDYMTRQPIQLNLRIHISYCKDENKTFVFHEVSPQPYTHAVWKNLHALWLSLRCKK
jgi:hypothetical protein